MSNTVDKVLKVAEKELGYYEKSESAYKKNTKILTEKVNGAGYDNYTKYGKEMHDLYPIVMDFPAPYCDAFVDWCFYKAYGIATAKSLLCGNFDDYTVASCKMYENKKALYKTPKTGDQVFFTKNGNVSGCYHTGLVYKVDEYYFYTYEGNTSSVNAVVANGGGVFAKQYSIANYRNKVLFGRPPYDNPKVSAKKKKYSGTFPTLPQKNNEYYLEKGDKGEQVRLLQLFLNWYGKYGLVIDGDFGEKTESAIKNFQSSEKLKVDGLFGEKSLAKAKKVKK